MSHTGKGMKRSAGENKATDGDNNRKQLCLRRNDESGDASNHDCFGNTGHCCSCPLAKAMECQVCLKVAVSPIHVCDDGGHIICYLCHEKLAASASSKCPSCSSAGFHESPDLERIAKMFKYKRECQNLEAGCHENILTTDFKEHLKNCVFR